MQPWRMATTETPVGTAPRSGLPLACRWLLRSWTFRIIGGLISLIVLFYLEENLRGKRAWESCRRELIARGEKVDWSDFMPSPVADADNIFAATNMSRWFVGKGGGPLSALMNQSSLDQFVRQHNTNIVARIRVLPADSEMDLA